MQFVKKKKKKHEFFSAILFCSLEVECVLIFAWVCNSQYYVYTEQVMLHLYWPVTGMCLLKYYIYSAGHATSILTCLLQVCTCWRIIYTQQVILYWPVCYRYVLTESDAGKDRTITAGDLHAVLCLCLHRPWSLHLWTDAVTGPDCWH